MFSQKLNQCFMIKPFASKYSIVYSGTSSRSSLSLSKSMSNKSAWFSTSYGLIIPSKFFTASSISNYLWPYLSSISNRPKALLYAICSSIGEFLSYLLTCLCVFWGVLSQLRPFLLSAWTPHTSASAYFNLNFWYSPSFESFTFSIALGSRWVGASYYWR